MVGGSSTLVVWQWTRRRAGCTPSCLNQALDCLWNREQKSSTVGEVVAVSALVQWINRRDRIDTLCRESGIRSRLSNNL